MVMPDQMELFETASAMSRDTPEVSSERAALVGRWQDTVRADKKHWGENVFKQMREDMEYARLGASKEWRDRGDYTVPIITRHINQAVAALYARNPKAQAKRRPRLNFTAWDGDPTSLAAAQEAAMMGDPAAMELLMEVQSVKAYNQMLDRLGKTLEILFGYYTSEQSPTFKVNMKQAVRRAKVCGVAFIKLGFQRLMEPNPEITTQIEDVSGQLAKIEAYLADAADDELAQHEDKVEELRLMLADLQDQEFMIVREGPIFDFPRANEVIPDRHVRELRGFTGARYVTQEWHMDVDRIKAVYKVDVGSSYHPYEAPSDAANEAAVARESDDAADAKPAKSGVACVWEVWDKENRQVLTLVDGYPDFIREPATPRVNLERFWPFFTIMFNDVEDPENPYPVSDVRSLRDAQDEYNRSRQGKREHRMANRPKYFARRGMLEEADKIALQASESNAIIELNALEPGVSIDALLQPHRPVPVDPNLYDTGEVLQDILYGVGAQEANLGPTGGGTATESSIAESSRMTAQQSNVDDLDNMLTDLAAATSQLCLLELDGATVRKIAGPGAPWPEASREEIMEEIHLEVKAGSSGRPNKAADLANMERGMPYLLQMPDISPRTLASRYADLLDMDMEELLVEGMPSITALNAMAGRATQPGTGRGDTDPASQGGQGATNAPNPQENQAGPQPAYPAGEGMLQ